MPRKWRLNIGKRAKALGWVRLFNEYMHTVILKAAQCEKSRIDEQQQNVINESDGEFSAW